MKIRILLIISIFLNGCDNKTNTSHDLIDEIHNDGKTEYQTKDPVKNALKNDDSRNIDLIGQWNLKMINYPWDIPFEDEDSWRTKRDDMHFGKIEFDAANNLIFYLNDSIVKTVKYSLGLEKSGFSSDSVWHIISTTNVIYFEMPLEIEMNGNEMTLLEKCDDCKTFVFNKIVNTGESTDLNSPTEFTTYVEYKDSLPLFDSANGKVVSYFRFEDDPDYDFGGGFTFNNSVLGWLQISEDEFYPEVSGLWIKSEYVFIGTRNYANQVISLKEEPNDNSRVIGLIYQETETTVLKFQDNWIYVKIEDEEGWLAPEFICTNPLTTCG